MKSKVTISRYSDHTIRIRIEDVASSIEFAEVQMTPEAFGEAITGLACQEAELTVKGLQFVGKNRIVEARQVECPLSTYDRKEMENWLRDNAQEDGWIVNAYLGCQSSVKYNDGKTFLNYSVTKYV